MTGTGPLGRSPAGAFNFKTPPPGEAVYVEPTPKRVRVQLGGVTIADSRRAMILHESGRQPVYYFPAQDVSPAALIPTSHRTSCPRKGQASHYTVAAGGETVPGGAWCHPDPPEGLRAIAGLIAFRFEAMGRWLEEDEQIEGHPRDPYHRIDVLRTDRHIRVLLDGVLLADTRRALALFESNLPARWYMPRADVLVELRPSATVTHCPYKGTASYWSVDHPAGDDLVWCYERPLPEVGRIAGMVCFYSERVDLELDGELQPRPGS
ncbi:MAG TPA: DUF427 domain-containing protein [Solirubrobacteraceae bacterium]|nr:DUF427 domain-containing protein [Solirubrobacteraceae bacterium]